MTEELDIEFRSKQQKTDSTDDVPLVPKVPKQIYRLIKIMPHTIRHHSFVKKLMPIRSLGRYSCSTTPLKSWLYLYP